MRRKNDKMVIKHAETCKCGMCLLGMNEPRKAEPEPAKAKGKRAMERKGKPK